MEHGRKRFVGLDPAKLTVEVRILGEGEGSERHGGVKTDGKGGERPASLLRKDDVAGREACSVAFLLGRYLRETAGRTVYILNPGKPQMIRKSTRKTDKEDARKTAVFIMRNPEGEPPPVGLPAEEEEEARNPVSMKRFLTRMRTGLINRLHAVYVQAGHTALKKNDPAGGAGRERQRGYRRGRRTF
jgi:transposase